MRFVVGALCVLTLEVVAFINAYVVNLKGATVDAERFLALAAEWMRYGDWQLVFDSEFYVQFLGAIFRVFGESEFLIAQLNILALAVACRYFHKICFALVGKTSSALTVLFMLWPAMIPRATTALREPILILSVVLTCFFLLRYTESDRTRYLVKSFAALAVGALFHKAFAVAFVGFVISTTLVLPWLKAHRFSLADAGRRLVIVSGVVVLIAAVVQLAGTSRGLLPLVAALSSDTEAIQRVVERKSTLDFRATYDYPIDVSSPGALIASLPRNWMAYNFLPFPWQVANSVDAYAVLEAGFRFLGFLLLAALYLRFPSKRRVLMTVVLVHLLLMMIWAAGTANYGTASRHHLTTNWMFLVYYWCYLRRRRWIESDRRSRRITKGGHDLALQELPG